MAEINFLAVFYGLATFIGLSLAVGLVMGLAVIADAKRQGGDKAGGGFDNMPRMDELMTAGAVMISGLVILSFLISVFGGYVAARTAGQGMYFHAGMVGVLGATLGLVMEMQMPTMPRWMVVLVTLGTIPAALAGAWIAGG